MPAWHGTLLPQGEADVWLATAFAEYERIYSREKMLRGKDGKKDLTPADRDSLAVDLFRYRSDYLTAARASLAARIIPSRPKVSTKSTRADSITLASGC